MNDLIIFDEKCPLCQKGIQWIIKKDKQHKFLFTDLHGMTAKKKGISFKKSQKETIILIENFNSSKERVFFKSQALFKIFWNLGGIYKCIGWKYILPSFLFDWAYNLIARNRRHFCHGQRCDARDVHLQRFLP